VLSLLDEARLVDDQNAARVAEGFESIGAHQIAQLIGVPRAAPKRRLHARGAFKTGLLGQQPARLALDPREKAVEKDTGCLPRLRPASRPIRSLSALNSRSQASTDPDHSATAIALSCHRQARRTSPQKLTTATVIRDRHEAARIRVIYFEGAGVRAEALAMTAPLSRDLRGRIARAVSDGRSIRQAAERLAVSPSAAIKLMRRVRQTGSAAPAKIGGHRSARDHQARGASVPFSSPDSPDLTPSSSSSPY